MTYILLLLALLIGAAIGFGAAWYMKDMELAIEKRALQERKGDIDNLDARFKAVAGDVLRTHSQDFLTEFEKTRKLHNIDLEHREKDFAKLVDGLNKSMETVGSKMTEFEKQRSEQFGALGQSIKHVLDTGHQNARDGPNAKNRSVFGECRAGPMGRNGPEEFARRFWVDRRC